jgi:DNA-3-methyladenine glycosylase II
VGKSTDLQRLILAPLAQYSFTLDPVPPFRLDLTAWILRRRPDNLVDRWDGRTYQRMLVLDGEPVEVSVTQLGPPDGPRLKVYLHGKGANAAIEPRIRAALERLLGVQVDLRRFYLFAESRAGLKDLVGQFRGSKPPRFPTYFETLVNAIACQQLSLTVGIRLLNRLAQTYGPALQMEGSAFHAFPRPEDMADADVEELRNLGFSYQKGRYLTSLARSIVDRQLNLDQLKALEDSAAVEQLCRIKGVGRWTAEYFLLRGLGRTHIFPGDDVGARNHLQRWLALPERLDYGGVHQALAGWEEFGGLIYFHLLLKSLVDTGIAKPGPFKVDDR